MTIYRWGAQYNIIDYTPKNSAEEDFVLAWMRDNREVLHDVQIQAGTYTFKAINAVIAEFDRVLTRYKVEDLHLQQMEAYFNEH